MRSKRKSDKKARQLIIIVKLLVVLLFMIFELQAQNLVPNGSFEDFSTCPNSLAQLHFADFWFAPQQSSELYNQCSIDPFHYSTVPQNNAGFQYARTGSGYAGCVFAVEHNDYHENITAYLRESLTAGEEYTLTYFISSPELAGRGVDNPSGLLTTDSIFPMTSLGRILLKPQVKLSDVYFADSVRWMKVSGSFIAGGGENYLTIGTFTPHDSTQFIFIHNNNDLAHYYIDDVSLYPSNTIIHKAAAGNDTVVCRGERVLVGAPGRDEYTYQWTASDSSINYQTAQISIIPDSTTTYYLRVMDFKYDVTYDTVEVRVINCSQPDVECILFPNPNSGSFYIELNHLLNSPALLYLYNMNGMLVLQRELNADSNVFQVSEPTLASGMYMWIFEHEGIRKYSGKFVLVR